MKVRVYFCRGKPDPSEIEGVDVLQRWMIENLYDLGWEGEFKNLVTPQIVASAFRAEPSPSQIRRERG